METTDPFDLDALEAVAIIEIARTYDIHEMGISERFWVQKGIEGMRLAVALAKERAELTND